MAVTHLALLLAAAVSSCCAWHLPALPAQHRAQYYVLHDDGAYKHGFDTGEGQWAAAKADASNQVTGEWQSVDDTGKAVHWAYTAGVQGYVPVLGGAAGVVPIVAVAKNAPVAPPTWQAPPVAPPTWQAPPAAPPTWKAPPVAPPTWIAPPAQTKHSVDAQAGTGDASYQFQYEADDHSRQESADKEGSVVGSYQFKADDGVQRRVDYIAGKDTGFIAKGDHLPVAPEVPAVPAPSVPVAPQAKSWSGQTKQSSWSSSSSGNVPAPKVSTHSQSAASSQESVVNQDGSYQFQYVADDHSRQESADAKGSVVGSYQFKTDDGVQRRVDYVAGKDTGFIAKGDHLPVAPEVPTVPAPHAPVAPQAKSWSSQTKQSSWASTPTVSQVPTISTHLQVPAWTASSGRGDTHGDSEGGKAFSYSYDAVLSAKQETADEQGNVAGSFQFVDGAGQQRSLTYTVNGDEGFVAKGDHLPVAPEVPVVPAPHQVPVAPQTKSWSQQASWSSSGNVPAQKTASTHSQSAASSQESVVNQDGSYQFQYVADDHSRQESADAKGSVVGSYQFKADDGVQRRVDYVAGKDTGFIAKGDHLPVAPEVPVVPAPQQVPAPHYVPVAPEVKSWSHQTSWSSSGNIPAPKVSTHSQSAASSQESVVNQDGSYQFQYVADDHSRQESADAKGSVVGSYQFKTDDGVQRRVDYVAGKDTGFIAKGDHLPVAPEVPAVPAPHAPVAPQAKSWSNHGAWSSSTTGGAAKASGGGWSRQDEQVQGEVDQQESSNVDDEQQALEDQQVLQTDEAQRAKDEAIAQADAQALAAEQQANEQQLAQQEAELQAQAAQAQSDTEQAQALAEVQNSKDRAEETQDEAERRAELENLKQEAEHRSVQEQQEVHVGQEQGQQQWQQQGQQQWQQQQQVQHVQQKSVAVAQPAHAANVAGSDSYSFSYSTDTQSVQQQSGAGNAARGSYSFVAPDDNQWRKVDWTAAAGKGFIASGDHLPVAPVPQEPVAPASWKSSSSAATTKSWTGGVKTSSHTVQTPHIPHIPQTSHDDQDNGDGSYKYSYHTDTAQKQETADKDGSVTGSFSYQGPDGVLRRLDYTANDRDGFVAKGDHLPGSTSSSGGHVATWTTDARTATSGNHGSTGTWGGNTGVKSTSTASSGSGNAWGVKAAHGVKTSHVSTETSGGRASLDGWGLKTSNGGVKSSHSSTTGIWGAKSVGGGVTGGHGSRPYAPLPVVKTPVVKHFPEVEVTRYLPPESPKKFGYAFEAKA